MFEITKVITSDELLVTVEEAKNIGIVGLVFAICAIVLLALFFCAYLEIDKINDKKIANLENLLSEEVEKNSALEYQVRFYCNSVVPFQSNDTKKGKKK